MQLECLPVLYLHHLHLTLLLHPHSTLYSNHHRRSANLCVSVHMLDTFSDAILKQTVVWDTFYYICGIVELTSSSSFSATNAVGGRGSGMLSTSSDMVSLSLPSSLLIYWLSETLASYRMVHIYEYKTTMLQFMFIWTTCYLYLCIWCTCSFPVWFPFRGASYIPAIPYTATM